MTNNSTNQDNTKTEYQEMVCLIEEAKKFYLSAPVIAKEKAESALNLAKQLNDYPNIAVAQLLIVLSYAYSGHYKESISAALENIAFIHQYLPENINILSNTYNVAGAMYMQVGQFQKALNILFTAAAVESPYMSDIQNNIGCIYMEVGNSEKAIEAWQTALKYTDKEKDPYRYMATVINIVQIYLRQGANENARQVFNTIIDIVEKAEHDEKANFNIYIDSLNVFGELCRQEKKYDAALEILNRSLELAQAKEMIHGYCFGINTIAKLYFDKHREIDAIEILQEGIQYADIHNIHGVKKSMLEQIIGHYKKTDQHAKAFPYLEQLYEMSQEQMKTSREKDFEAIIDEREREIQVLESKNQEIEKHNTILKQFTHIISHDLREPVRGINGFANLLNKKFKDKLGETGEEYISFILSETGNINNKLARLLEYTSLKKPEKNQIRSLSIHEIIERQKQQFSLIDKLDIIYDDTCLEMEYDHADKLIYELIDNAVKFRKEEQYCRIEISGESKNAYQHIYVKDYGIGIAEKYQQRVFKIFNQLDKQTKGAGVGLAICERIIELYKGRIHIESVAEEFTIFRFSLPDINSEFI